MPAICRAIAMGLTGSDSRSHRCLVILLVAGPDSALKGSPRFQSVSIAPPGARCNNCHSSFAVSLRALLFPNRVVL